MGDVAKRIGVAMSGGGYRASAWGLGVAWCLSDMALAPSVTTVSSVSGGSLTNAYEGLLGDVSEAQGRAFAERLAGRPRGFATAMLVTVASAIGSAVAVCRDARELALALVGVMLLAGIAGAATSGDLLFNRWGLWLYVDSVLLAAPLTVWAWPRWYCVLVPLVLWLMLRGPVVGMAMGRSLRLLAGVPRAHLSDLAAKPERVLLATELHAGHHACFGRDFVHCHDFGLGSKPALPLRTAVQASANLPGAFPTRWLRTSGMGFVGADEHAWLALTDGGVYDNMADQWHLDYGKRIAKWAAPAFDQYRAVVDRLAAAEPEFVVVANASGALTWRPLWKDALPLAGELFGLLHVKDVLYDNGASVRRTHLVHLFDSGARGGTLVHIATSPYDFPRFASTRPELAVRAATAVAWLDGLGVTKDEWKERMKEARGVGTQLWPLGRKATENLVVASYVQAAVNLHIRLGTPLPASLPF